MIKIIRSRATPFELCVALKIQASILIRDYNIRGESIVTRDNNCDNSGYKLMQRDKRITSFAIRSICNDPTFFRIETAKKLHDGVQHFAVERAILQFVEPVIPRPHSLVFRDKKVAKSARRPGGRFTLKSRRKLLKRDVAYENVGTVKISAFTCSAFSLTFSLSSSFSRLHASSSRSSSKIAQGARSFMHDRNGLRISSRNILNAKERKREKALGFLEGKILKAPEGI